MNNQLSNIFIKDIMTTNVIYVNPEEGVIKAFEVLLKHKISCLPVADRDKKIVGIVTTTDIGHNLIEDKYTLDTKVKDVMTRDVITIGPDEPIINAIKKMDEYGPKGEIINQLPVVDDNNRLIGIVSDGDIIRVLSRYLK
ncbi:MAG TPA: CBS domain-containing protein [Methanothermococcus okinawensis]|uniref:CBS domain-containing protein n=1 Tax=Methanothermococcus okinawensis TaxID=155863 RepID=A0A833DRQ5_9EURY|nr:CBS domain-containing protein [Methanothermococcus okinawensis]